MANSGWKVIIFRSPGNKKAFLYQVEAGMIYPGVFCCNCGSAYPEDGIPYCCSTCGGLYDFRDGLPFDPDRDRTIPAWHLAFQAYVWTPAGSCASLSW